MPLINFCSQRAMRHMR